MCLGTFHVIGWATDALDEVRRRLLLRNWQNLTGRQRSVIRSLDGANRRLLRAWLRAGQKRRSIGDRLWAFLQGGRATRAYSVTEPATGPPLAGHESQQAG